jgi:cell division protein FtsL
VRWRNPEKTPVYHPRTPENISTRRRGQRGEGRAKAILFTVIFVAAIYAAFKIVPAYVSEYQLNDKMQEVARFAVVNRYTPEQIRENIFKEIEDLDIPAKREDIKVTATTEVVKISLEYTVPVNLLVYNTELHFSPSSENKSLF